MTTQTNAILECGYCTEYDQVSRREFMGGGLASAASLIFGGSIVSLPRWMPRLSLADPHQGPAGDALVCIFLRGGADGLNMIVPHGDEDYYQGRPTIGIPRPDDNRAEARVSDLDGFFGLHPALQPLADLYQAGDLALVHAAGSPDETRSHFEAMALMERGVAERDYTGWLARHLATLDTGNVSALRAVAIDDMLPGSLTGAVSATALQSIGEYHLIGRDVRNGGIEAFLRAIYSRNGDLLAATADRTFAAIEILSKIDIDNYTPRGRPFPQHTFGRALQSISQLVTAEVGLEVACVDLGGWDTHVAQGGTQGLMANLMTTLSEGLAAFYEDLGERRDKVTVVVMSEFGRRLGENAGLGTDHGHGNAMMVLGGGINGGRVYANWPGLAEGQLAGPGDLAITTDYRDVLGEIISQRLGNPRLSDIFPGHNVSELGLAVARQFT